MDKMKFKGIEYEEISKYEYDKLQTGEGIYLSDHYTGKVHYFKKIKTKDGK